MMITPTLGFTPAQAETPTTNGLCSRWGSFSPWDCVNQQTNAAWCKEDFHGTFCQYPTLGLTPSYRSTHWSYANRYVIPHDVFYDGQDVELIMTELDNNVISIYFFMALKSTPTVTIPLGPILTPLKPHSMFTLNRLDHLPYGETLSESDIYTITYTIHTTTSPNTPITKTLGDITIAKPCNYIDIITNRTPGSTCLLPESTNAGVDSVIAACDPREPMPTTPFTLNDPQTCFCSKDNLGIEIDHKYIGLDCRTRVEVGSSYLRYQFPVDEFLSFNKPLPIPLDSKDSTVSFTFFTDDLYTQDVDGDLFPFGVKWISGDSEEIMVVNQDFILDIPTDPNQPSILIIDLSKLKSASILTQGSNLNAQFVLTPKRELSNGQSSINFPVTFYTSQAFFDLFTNPSYNQGLSLALSGMETFPPLKSETVSGHTVYDWSRWVFEPSSEAFYRLISSYCDTSPSTAPNIFRVGERCEYKITVPEIFTSSTTGVTLDMAKPYRIIVELFDESTQIVANWWDSSGNNISINSLFVSSHFYSTEKPIQTSDYFDINIFSNEGYGFEIILMAKTPQVGLPDLSTTPFRLALSFGNIPKPLFISSPRTITSSPYCQRAYFSADKADCDEFYVDLVVGTGTENKGAFSGYTQEFTSFASPIAIAAHSTPSTPHTLKLCMTPPSSLMPVAEGDCYGLAVVDQNALLEPSFEFSYTFANHKISQTQYLYIFYTDDQDSLSIHYAGVYRFPSTVVHTNEVFFQDRLPCNEANTHYGHYVVSLDGHAHTNYCICKNRNYAASPIEWNPIYVGDYCQLQFVGVLNHYLRSNDDLKLIFQKSNQDQEIIYPLTTDPIYINLVALDTGTTKLYLLDSSDLSSLTLEDILPGRYSIEFKHSGDHNRQPTNSGIIITIVTSSELGSKALSPLGLQLCDQTGTQTISPIVRQRADGRYQQVCECKSNYYGPRCDIQFNLYDDNTSNESIRLEIVTTNDLFDVNPYVRAKSSQKIAVAIVFQHGSEIEYYNEITIITIGTDPFHYVKKPITYDATEYKIAVKFLEEHEGQVNSFNTLNIVNNKMRVDSNFASFLPNNKSFQLISCRDQAVPTLCTASPQSKSSTVAPCVFNHYSDLGTSNCSPTLRIKTFTERIAKNLIPTPLSVSSELIDDGENRFFFYLGQQVFLTPDSITYDVTFDISPSPLSLTISSDPGSHFSISPSNAVVDIITEDLDVKLTFSSTGNESIEFEIQATILPLCKYLHHLTSKYHFTPPSASFKYRDNYCNPAGSIDHTSPLCQVANWDLDEADLLGAGSLCDCKPDYFGTYCEFHISIGPIPREISSNEYPDGVHVVFKIDRDEVLDNNNNFDLQGSFLPAIGFDVTNIPILPYTLESFKSVTILHKLPADSTNPDLNTATTDSTVDLDVEGYTTSYQFHGQRSSDATCTGANSSHFIQQNEFYQQCQCVSNRFGPQCQTTGTLSVDIPVLVDVWAELLLGDKRIVYWGQALSFTTDTPYDSSWKFYSGYGTQSNNTPGQEHLGTLVSHHSPDQTTAKIFLPPQMPHPRDPITNRITSRIAPSSTSIPLFLQGQDGTSQHIDSGLLLIWDACDVIREVDRYGGTDQHLLEWKNAPMLCHLPNTESCFPGGFLSTFEQIQQTASQIYDKMIPSTTLSYSPPCKCKEPTVTDGIVTAYIGNHCQTTITFVAGPYYQGQKIHYEMATAGALDWKNDPKDLATLAGTYPQSRLNPGMIQIHRHDTNQESTEYQLSQDYIVNDYDGNWFTIPEFIPSDENYNGNFFDVAHYDFFFTFGNHSTDPEDYSYALSSTKNLPPTKILTASNYNTLYISKQPCGGFDSDFQTIIYNPELDRCDDGDAFGQFWVDYLLGSQYANSPLFYGKNAEFKLHLTSTVVSTGIYPWPTIHPKIGELQFKLTVDPEKMSEMSSHSVSLQLFLVQGTPLNGKIALSNAVSINIGTQAIQTINVSLNDVDVGVGNTIFVSFTHYSSPFQSQQPSDLLHNELSVFTTENLGGSTRRYPVNIVKDLFDITGFSQQQSFDQFMQASFSSGQEETSNDLFTESLIYFFAPPTTIFTYTTQDTDVYHSDVVVSYGTPSPGSSYTPLENPFFMVTGGFYHVALTNLEADIDRYNLAAPDSDPAFKLYLVKVEYGASYGDIIDAQYFQDHSMEIVDEALESVTSPKASLRFTIPSSVEQGNYLFALRHNKVLYFNWNGIYTIVESGSPLLDETPYCNVQFTPNFPPEAQCNLDGIRDGSISSTNRPDLCPYLSTISTHTMTRYLGCACKSYYYDQHCDSYVEIIEGNNHPTNDADGQEKVYSVEFQTSLTETLSISLYDAPFTTATQITVDNTSRDDIDPANSPTDSGSVYTISFKLSLPQESSYNLFIHIDSATTPEPFFVTVPIAFFPLIEPCECNTPWSANWECHTPCTCSTGSFRSIDGQYGAFGDLCQGVIAFNPTQTPSTWESFTDNSSTQLHAGEEIMVDVNTLAGNMGDEYQLVMVNYYHHDTDQSITSIEITKNLMPATTTSSVLGPIKWTVGSYGVNHMQTFKFGHVEMGMKLKNTPVDHKLKYFYIILPVSQTTNTYITDAFIMAIQTSNGSTTPLEYQHFHPMQAEDSQLSFDPATRLLNGLQWRKPLRAKYDRRFNYFPQSTTPGNSMMMSSMSTLEAASTLINDSSSISPITQPMVRFYLKLGDIDIDTLISEDNELDLSSSLTILRVVNDDATPAEMDVWIPESTFLTSPSLSLPNQTTLDITSTYSIIIQSSQYELGNLINSKSILAVRKFRVTEHLIDESTDDLFASPITPPWTDTIDHYNPVCPDNQLKNHETWGCDPLPANGCKLQCKGLMVSNDDCTACICSSPLCETLTRQFMLYPNPASGLVKDMIQTTYQMGYWHWFNYQLMGVLQLTKFDHKVLYALPTSQLFTHSIYSTPLGYNANLYSSVKSSTELRGVVVTITLTPTADNNQPTAEMVAEEFRKIQFRIENTFHNDPASTKYNQDILKSFWGGFEPSQPAQLTIGTTASEPTMRPILYPVTHESKLYTKCQTHTTTNPQIGYCPRVSQVKRSPYWSGCQTNIKFLNTICYDLNGNGLVDPNATSAPSQWCNPTFHPSTVSILSLPCTLSTVSPTIDNILVAPEGVIPSGSTIHLEWDYSGPENYNIALWLMDVVKVSNGPQSFMILSDSSDSTQFDDHTLGNDGGEEMDLLLANIDLSTLAVNTMIGKNLYLGTHAAIKKSLMVHLPESIYSPSGQENTNFFLQLTQSVLASRSSRKFTISDNSVQCATQYRDQNGRCGCAQGVIDNYHFLADLSQATCTCLPTCGALSGSTNSCTVADPSHAVCTCASGFGGDDCTTNLSLCPLSLCSNHGFSSYNDVLSQCSTCQCNTPWSGPSCSKCSLSCDTIGGETDAECSQCTCKNGFGGLACKFREFLATIRYSTTSLTPVISDAVRSNLIAAVAVSLGVEPTSVDIKRVNTTVSNPTPAAYQLVDTLSSQNEDKTTFFTQLFAPLQTTPTSPTSTVTSITFGIVSTTTSTGTQTSSMTLNDLYNSWTDLQGNIKDTPISSIDTGSFDGSSPIADDAYDPLCDPTVDTTCPTGKDPLTDPVVPPIIPDPDVTTASTSSVIGIVIGVVVGAVFLFIILAFVLWYMNKNEKGCFATKSSNRQNSSKRSLKNKNDNAHLDLGDNGTEMSSATNDRRSDEDLSGKNSTKKSSSRRKKSHTGSGSGSQKSATADLDPIKDDEELPPNWSKFKHKATGEILYVNTVEMTSQKSSPNGGTDDQAFGTSGNWF